MKNLLGNTSVPPYLKLMSAALLAVTYLAILVYAGYYAAMHGGSLDGMPTVVSLVIGAGLSYALQILGIHTGASVSESGTPQIGAVRLTNPTPVSATLVPTPAPVTAPTKVESDGPAVG